MKVFVVAGEPSGDRLGQAVMAGLRRLVPDIRFAGVGGELMQGEGLASLFPMDELSVMGLAEILPRYPHLRRRMIETAEAAVAFGPDVLLTIDSPDFCLRVARRVKSARPAIRTVHYVAPTVWAWRPGRARRMARMIDHVLALFPFEPPYMEAAGMACDFVGHPVTTEPVATAAEAEDFRKAHAVGAGPLVLALPGSRRGEVTRLSSRFGQALALVAQARPGTRVVLPAAGPVRDLVRDAVADWPLDPILLDPREDPGGRAKRAAFRAADVALAASGTVSLELAAAATPMVIAYDMAPLSRFLIGRMLLTDTVTLVNLVAESRTVPEFIGKACQPGPIAEALLRLLDVPGIQGEAMARTMERLGAGGPPPGERAAAAILARLPRSSGRKYLGG